MARRTTTLAASALLSAAVLGGCGSEAAETASDGPPLSTATQTSTSAPPTSAATSAPAGGSTGGAGQEEPPFVPLDQAGEAPGSGAASITAVRLGEHDGFDRVVLDLEGEPGQRAGWFVAAVPRPVQEASGELLEVEGERFLDLAVTGVANAAAGQVDSAGRAAFTGSVDGSGDLVEQVLVGGAWEGQVQVLIGVDGRAAEYRVTALSDPQRIVVDVR